MNVLLEKKHLYPLLAFAVPLLLRVIPEVLMGPYVVGFDTMAHYAPTTALWLSGGVDLWNYIAIAPLFYTLIVSLVSLGGPLLLVLKIVPPLLHGFLGLSIYGYAKIGLNWSPKKSAFTALLATAYFVAMRISWDLLRNELALVFFFVVLTLMHPGCVWRSQWKRYLLLTLGMAAVVLSNQLVAVIMLGMIAFTVLHGLVRRKWLDAAKLMATAMPSAIVFFAALYLSPAVSEFRLIFGFPATSDGWLALFGYSSYPAMLAGEIGFFLYCFLFLLPLAILSFRRFRDFQMRTWLVLILIASLIPLVSPSNLRWIMMLIYPLAFYVAEGMSRLRSMPWKWFKMTALKAAAVYLAVTTAVLSLGFMMDTPENPLPYFNPGQLNGYIYQIPSSMLQNTVSISDCADTAKAFAWFRDNAADDAVMLAHRAFYGWAMLTLNERQVVLYEYDNPVQVAEALAQSGQSHLYVVWWISGLGWYGQSSLSSDFEEVYRVGRMAVYAYKPAT
ncbi:MAG: hypothetical protein ACE14S_08140 [Candidatus Bathyarchaeia archaeon]